LQRNGLYVGRFQPFHLGHLAAVRYALTHVDFLYIVVGSADKSHEPENPFTVAERLAMLRAALSEAGVDSRLWLPIPVPDIQSHYLWPQLVEMYVPPFEVVFSNEPLTMRLFEERGKQVVQVPLFKRDIYSATEVRRRIVNDEDWEELLPPAVVRFLNEIGGPDRIRVLNKKQAQRRTAV
jgi:nicotinamide-nucleotide adenylyltransferase